MMEWEEQENGGSEGAATKSNSALVPTFPTAAKSDFRGESASLHFTCHNHTCTCILGVLQLNSRHQLVFGQCYHGEYLDIYLKLATRQRRLSPLHIRPSWANSLDLNRIEWFWSSVSRLLREPPVLLL